MGNCFSDPSGPSKKGGQVLGSGPAQPASASGPSTTGGGGGGRVGAAGSQNGRPPQPLGGGVSEMGRERERALAAAEERAKAASKKGVNSSNPNAGKLSNKLQEERRTPRSPEPQGDNRMMDKGDWN